MVVFFPAGMSPTGAGRPAAHARCCPATSGVERVCRPDRAGCARLLASGRGGMGWDGEVRQIRSRSSPSVSPPSGV